MVPEPSVVIACPEEPAELGKVKVQVPAAAAGVMVTVPLVVPANFNCPVAVPDTPMVKLVDNIGEVVTEGTPVELVLSIP